jgi:hypothetical protein
MAEGSQAGPRRNSAQHARAVVTMPTVCVVERGGVTHQRSRWSAQARGDTGNQLGKDTGSGPHRSSRPAVRWWKGATRWHFNGDGGFWWPAVLTEEGNGGGTLAQIRRGRQRSGHRGADKSQHQRCGRVECTGFGRSHTKKEKGVAAALGGFYSSRLGTAEERGRGGVAAAWMRDQLQRRCPTSDSGPRAMAAMSCGWCRETTRERQRGGWPLGPSVRERKCEGARLSSGPGPNLKFEN